MSLRMVELRATFRAVETLRLPPYLGSMMRGAFGHAFKGAVCVMRDRTCSRCMLVRTCLYPRVFETAAEGADLGHLGIADQAPRPLVWAPGMDTPRIVRPGEALTFGLRLFGWATDYAAYMTYALTILAQRRLRSVRPFASVSSQRYL